MSSDVVQQHPAGHRLRRVAAAGGGHLWLLHLLAEGVTLPFGDEQAARMYIREVEKERRQAAAGTRTGSS